jgi:hypothetical protein
MSSTKTLSGITVGDRQKAFVVGSETTLAMIPIPAIKMISLWNSVQVLVRT